MNKRSNVPGPHTNHSLSGKLRPRIDKRRRKSRQGAAAVEMAVVLPIIVLLLFGIFEFGRALEVKQLLTGAARRGARLATLSSSTNATVEAEIRQHCQNVLGTDPGDLTFNITVAQSQANIDAGKPNPGNEIANCLRGDICTVQVGINFDLIRYISGTYLNGQMLTAFCTMEHE